MLRVALFTGLLVASTGTVVAQSAPVRTVEADSPEGRTIASNRAVPPPTATIRYGKRPLNTGQLRIPTGKGPFPIAIMIHGGCFTAEMGEEAMESTSEMLRQRGIATWDIDYARGGNPGGGWPGTFEDIRDGVDYLPRLAKRYRLDLSRVTAVGHSAGALFASWTAARPKLPAPWTAKPGAMTIHSMVAIDGPSTLAPMVGIDKMVCGKPVIVPWMGGTPTEMPEAYKLASAADYLPLGVRQMLVFADLGEFMRPYLAVAKASGDEVVTLTPPKADHFDIVTKGMPNGELVADWIAYYAFQPPKPKG